MICGAIDLLFENADFESVRRMLKNSREGVAHIDRGSAVYLTEGGQIAEGSGVSLFAFGDPSARVDVLLARYASEGPRLLDSISGNAALVLIDRRRETAKLARLGESRLYYAQSGRILLFSSDADAIPHAAEILGLVSFDKR